MKSKSEVIVIGHKNPDTDSVCSAIAYANLKSKIDEGFNYIPKVCGGISKETAFVLDSFGMEQPQLQKDVRTQVSDIEIKEVECVDRDISIKKAYNVMKEKEAFMLIVTKEDKSVEGVITLGDIAASDMDAYDNRILAEASTPYKNIIETLDSKVICGDVTGTFTEGKVAVAGNTPEIMAEFLEEGDLVIIGNRIESQFLAIEVGVKCMVLCMGNVVNDHILKLAESKGCVILSSPYDTYTVARLISKSMPIEYFMTTNDIIQFSVSDFTNDVKTVMAKTRLRYFPVLNEAGEYIGQISKRSFLDMDKKKVILVDHNEKNQAVDGIEYADILEIIDHHKLGSIETVNPVYFRNQPLGSTATIVYNMYCEKAVEITKEIAGLLVSAIISDTLMFRSPTCTFLDKKAAEELAKIAEIDIEKYSDQMFAAGSDFDDISEEELFYKDYKHFSFFGLTLGISQITALNAGTLSSLAERMDEYMDNTIKTRKDDILILMLTNIIEESSLLLFKGDKAKYVMEQAYSINTNKDNAHIKGLVSRKKQLVPEIMHALQR